MVWSMDDAGEQTERNPLGTAFAVAGLAASIAAFTATGGLAILAAAVAVLCLAGSVAASLAPCETPFERYCEECDQVAAVQDGQEDSIGPARQGEPSRSQIGHHWRQTIAASRAADRSR